MKIVKEWAKCWKYAGDALVPEARTFFNKLKAFVEIQAIKHTHDDYFILKLKTLRISTRVWSWIEYNITRRLR